MIKKRIKKFIGDIGLNNQIDRDLWVKGALQKLPNGAQILDAGAGEGRINYIVHT